MAARLVHSSLREYDGTCGTPPASAWPLRPKFELDELRMIRLEPHVENHVGVEVGFGLSLCPANMDDDSVVDVWATFRLVYLHDAGEEATHESIALTQAPKDAWHLFRAHVDRVLAEMSLPPLHGRLAIPRGLASLAPDVLKETADVDAQLDEKGEWHAPTGGG